MSTPAFGWLDPPDGPAIRLLDQTRLPAEEVYLTCAEVPELVAAIGRLAVRGAPLLGVAGAFGVALAAARGDDVEAAARTIASARPTAVNLARGVRRTLRAYQAAVAKPGPVTSQNPGAVAALQQARQITAADAAASTAMAAHGLDLVPAGPGSLRTAIPGASSRPERVRRSP